MKAGEFCNREVVVLEKGASVADAAGLMREHHVGSVVIVDSPEEPRRPVGVLTDRDIVLLKKFYDAVASNYTAKTRSLVCDTHGIHLSDCY